MRGACRCPLRHSLCSPKSLQKAAPLQTTMMKVWALGPVRSYARVVLALVACLQVSAFQQKCTVGSVHLLLHIKAGDPGSAPCTKDASPTPPPSLLLLPVPPLLRSQLAALDLAHCAAPLIWRIVRRPCLSA